TSMITTTTTEAATISGLLPSAETPVAAAAMVGSGTAPPYVRRPRLPWLDCLMNHLAEYTDDLAAFITASPSSYHAAAEVARRLDDEGFTPLAENEEWPTQPGGYYVLRDGALIAWLQPASAGPTTGFRVLGAHTDSPGFKLKPRSSTAAHG